MADLFDFYCGSSVGTLIISTLLLPDPLNPTRPKYNVNDVIDITMKKCNYIFETTMWQNLWTMWGYRLPKYSHDMRPLMYGEVFKQIQFGQLLGRVVFPVGDTISNRPIYLHNNHQLHAPLQLTDVLLGTTAAPTYYPSQSLMIDGKHVNLIDSAFVVNDTSQLAFVEAINLSKQIGVTGVEAGAIGDLYELSVGTGQASETYDSQWWGAIRWSRQAPPTLMDFNSDNQSYQLSLISEPHQVNRINPVISSELNHLDKPQYIPQYVAVAHQWIKDNDATVDRIVNRILTNKGYLRPGNEATSATSVTSATSATSATSVTSVV